mmetsp:Transcript_32464/g.41695  ORF Transcript_32464/g.41695 Transcript_32464/m.41695 type:complete len:84 (+) Transcript_32464:39-290(+)
MEIHCDIPQDQAIRAQRKNDQLGGVSKPRKGLKNRDPNKLVTNNSDGVVKPQQASIVIKSDNKLKYDNNSTSVFFVLEQLILV